MSQSARAHKRLPSEGSTTVLWPIWPVTAHWSVRLLAKLAVSGGLIWFIARKIDLTGISNQIVDEDINWLLLAALIVLVQVALGAMRWGEVLAALGSELPRRHVFMLSYISVFVNCWLVGSLGGDLARAMLTPKGSFLRSDAIYSVIFDRVLTLTGLALCVIPVVALNIGPLAHGIPVLAALVASLLPMVGMIALPVVSGLVISRPFALTRRVVELDKRWLRLVRTRQRFAVALVSAVLGQAAISATAFCIARALHLEATFLDMLLLMPPVTLVLALPLSFGGWGLRENAMVLALGTIGVLPSTAILLSIQMGLLATIVSLPGGAIWFYHSLLRVR